jgi:glycosyltransferase involved in cell wall biosynthesis
MRFLMLNWRCPRNPLSGGAERVTLGYLSSLASRGHDVYWFAPLFPGAEQTEDIEGVHIVRGGGIGSCIFAALRWQKRQPKFDLVIDQHHGIPWYAPWWSNTNTIAYIHEVLGPIWDSFYIWPKNVIGRHQERWTHWLYRNVPFWTASSDTKALLHAAGIKEVTLIPYGVHTVALSELEPKPLKAPLRLITVSRLAPNKRVEHAVQALHLLGRRNIEAHLTIVGAGDYEPEIRRAVADLQLGRRVAFTGAVSEADKERLMRESHLLLHASIREGWGLNVIEANAMGTPAVVYPVAGLVESTLHERTGLVAESETPEALAGAICRLVQSPDDYGQYRLQAWNRSKTFHWSVVLPQACDWLEGKAR